MFESKSGVLLVAGVLFFVFSFLVMGFIPWTIYKDEPELTLKELAQQGIIHEFVQLAEHFPKQFQQYYGEVSEESFAQALELGRKVYVGEACWHCHSQQIRPVSNEDRRWGPVSTPLEYQNVLQRPVLFGTRRVGPDLIREGARRSNDWHIAHFYKPVNVSPTSVMPEYPWLFDAEGYPNKKGMALITYIQWLGSWLKEYPYYQGEGPPPTQVRSAPDSQPAEARVSQPNTTGAPS